MVQKVINPAEIADRYERELLDHVISFWETHGIDRRNGGFFSCLERDGAVFDTMKQLWMQWRAVYMFAALYNSEYRQERYLEYAIAGFEFLILHGKRPDGLYYLILTADGQPQQLDADGAALFVESFAAIACAELYRATREKRYWAEAQSALANYRKRVRSATEPLSGAPRRKFFAHAMIELNTVTILQEVAGGAPNDALAASLLDFREPKSGIILERNLADGTFELDSQDGRFANPGHALEGMLFLLEHCMLGGDPRLIAPAVEVIRRTLPWGWDAEAGGIRYFRDLHDKPLAKNECMLKAWWPQNEAAVAALQAWRMTGEEEFLDWFGRIDEYAWRMLRDPEFGEWFAYAAVDGKQVHSYKGSRWKGFFHLPRYLLKSIRLLRGTAYPAV